MGKRVEQTIYKEKYMTGQEAHEKAPTRKTLKKCKLKPGELSQNTI